MPSPLPPDSRPRGRSSTGGRSGSAAISGAEPVGRRSRRERTVLGAIALATVALVVLVVLSLGSAAARSGRGCIHAVVPGPIGATSFDQCGATARATCTSLQVSNDLSRFGVGLLETQCRRAGLPIRVLPAIRTG